MRRSRGVGGVGRPAGVVTVVCALSLLAASCGAEPEEAIDWWPEAAETPGARSAPGEDGAPAGETPPWAEPPLVRIDPEPDPDAETPFTAFEAVVPETGTYRYASTLDAGPNGGVHQGRRTLTHYPPDEPDVDGSFAQTVRQTTQAGTAPDERVWWFRFRWQADGLYREKYIAPNYECTLGEPLLELPLPLTVGTEWRSRASCEEHDIRIGYDGEVTGVETLSVAGSEVETVVVRRESRRWTEGHEASPLVETRWISIEHGVMVRMRTESEEVTFTISDRLRSLVPGGLPSQERPPGY